VPFAALGTAIATASLVTLVLPRPAWREGALVGHIAHVDRFGNLITDIGPELTERILAAPGGVRCIVGAHALAARARTFAEGPAEGAFLLRDSSGHLALAVRNGSASAQLGNTRGAEVVVLGLSPPE
jgi:S-adenosylmethionine hydrolase